MTEIQQFFPLDYGNGWYSPRFPRKIHCVGAVTALWASLSIDERLLMERLSLTPVMFNDLAHLSQNLVDRDLINLRDLVVVVGLIKRFGIFRNGVKGRGKDALLGEAGNFPEFGYVVGEAGLEFSDYGLLHVVACAILTKIAEYQDGQKADKAKYDPMKCVQLVLYAVQQFGW